MEAKNTRKVLAFAASNSSRSINVKLLGFAATLIENTTVEIIDLDGYGAPIYSDQLERELGIPKSIVALHRKFLTADAFLIASPEHNGLMPAFFKNIIDWLSRIDPQIFHSRPVALISTSPGSRGGSGNLRILSNVMPWWGAQIMGTFSLPSFNEKFNLKIGSITDHTEIEKLRSLIKKLENEIN